LRRRRDGDSSRANLVGKIITKVYSGYVHAASPHVMDMYVGEPPRFDVSGKFGRWRRGTHADDALNYFLRALFSMAFAAKAFNDEKLFLELRAKAATLEAGMRARKAS
jgi:hypothetical protein